MPADLEAPRLPAAQKLERIPTNTSIRSAASKGISFVSTLIFQTAPGVAKLSTGTTFRSKAPNVESKPEVAFEAAEGEGSS